MSKFEIERESSIGNIIISFLSLILIFFLLKQLTQLVEFFAYNEIVNSSNLLLFSAKVG